MQRTFLAALFLAVAVARGVATDAPRPALREYDLLRAFPPGRLAAFSAGDRPEANGFPANNCAHGRWIESGPQRGSCRGVIASVVARDRAAVDNAWRGIRIASAHQRPDGGFIANPQANGKVARVSSADGESAYFFLQELGRAISRIRQSPCAAHFPTRLTVLEPTLRRAAAYLACGYATLVPKLGHSVNRVIIAATALSTCGVALGVEHRIAQSRHLIAHALTLRDKGGVFIDNGGYQSSFHVVSTLFNSVLALHVPLPEFAAVLPATFAGPLMRVLPTGAVDLKGTTHTGVGRAANAFGQAKPLNCTEVIFALTCYGLIHHDQAALDAATRVLVCSRPKTN